MNKNLSLVLEGGGMRGMFTTGVLDCFMDNGIEFRSAYGVSAGACHVCSFLSNQRGRAYRINVDYLRDWRYCSVRSLILTGDMFGAKMCYDTIPNKYDLYDYVAFDRNKTAFYAVVTNIKTGRAEYHRIADMRTDIQRIRASSSLPLVARPVELDGEYYLDGGITDSIPLRAALKAEGGKAIVVLTQPEGYVKKPTDMMTLMKVKYHKYPELIKAIANRHNMYNETTDYIQKCERNGSVIVIRPDAPLDIGRAEKNKEKLKAAYEKGYAQTEKKLKQIIEFE